jgi:glucokinase
VVSAHNFYDAIFDELANEAKMKNVIGVDIGGTRFRLALFDERGTRLLVSEDETSRLGGRDWMLEQIRERSRILISRSDHPVRACGVSFGGLVDFNRQLVTSLHTPGWANFALSKWLADTLGLPCQVDNYANAGALGEYRFGAARGGESMAYVSISTGVGSGLVLGGKVLRGVDSLAGELGHIPVSDSGVVRSCGARGCLETFCSGRAIAQRGTDRATRLLTAWVGLSS